MPKPVIFSVYLFVYGVIHHDRYFIPLLKAKAFILSCNNLKHFAIEIYYTTFQQSLDIIVFSYTVDVFMAFMLRSGWVLAHNNNDSV